MPDAPRPLSPTRLAALRLVAEGAVEYRWPLGSAGVGSYGVRGGSYSPQPPLRWLYKFALISHGEVDVAGRCPVTLTPAGQAALDAQPNPAPEETR